MAKITIYTTPTCHFCHAAKEYFKSKGLEWTEYDVSKDIPHQQEMIQRSGQMGVPVIDIDGQLIVGFDKTRIDQLLGN